MGGSRRQRPLQQKHVSPCSSVATLPSESVRTWPRIPSRALVAHHSMVPISVTRLLSRTSITVSPSVLTCRQVAASVLIALLVQHKSKQLAVPHHSMLVDSALGRSQNARRQQQLVHAGLCVCGLSCTAATRAAWGSTYLVFERKNVHVHQPAAFKPTCTDDMPATMLTAFLT